MIMSIKKVTSIIELVEQTHELLEIYFVIGNFQVVEHELYFVIR